MSGQTVSEKILSRHAGRNVAADDLNISQAAVSQQMRQLEANLNTPLFVRHHRRLSLTSTGQAYLEVVHEALDRLDSVTDRLFPGRHNQAVTLRCTSGVAALWLVPQLRSLQKLRRKLWNPSQQILLCSATAG